MRISKILLKTIGLIASAFGAVWIWTTVLAPIAQQRRERYYAWAEATRAVTDAAAYLQKAASSDGKIPLRLDPADMPPGCGGMIYLISTETDSKSPVTNPVCCLAMPHFGGDEGSVTVMVAFSTIAQSEVLNSKVGDSSTKFQDSGVKDVPWKEFVIKYAEPEWIAQILPFDK